MVEISCNFRVTLTLSFCAYHLLLIFSVLENLRLDAGITAAPIAIPTAIQAGSLVATAIAVPTPTPTPIHPPFLFFPNTAFLFYYSHSIVELDLAQ